MKNNVNAKYILMIEKNKISIRMMKKNKKKIRVPHNPSSLGFLELYLTSFETTKFMYIRKTSHFYQFNKLVILFLTNTKNLHAGSNALHTKKFVD